MLASLVYILSLLRRALRKLGRGFSILAASFAEAQEFRRALQPRHIDD